MKTAKTHVSRAATYVDKIFEDAKPADLRIGQPTKFELVINLKTAKAVGLTIPLSLLQGANDGSATSFRSTGLLCAEYDSGAAFAWRYVMRLRWKPCLVSALSVLLISGARAAPQEASEALSFVTWREPNEGAYGLSVPRGWKISGGIRHRTPVDVRSAVNVVSQGGAIHFFIGDYDVPPAREPDAATQMARLREGQLYDGTLLARYQTGVQFAQRYPAWKLCRQPQIVQSGILRKETETLSAEVARYGQSIATAASASVGEAIFRCGEAEGFVMATTLLARPASRRGASVWGVYQCQVHPHQDAG